MAGVTRVHADIGTLSPGEDTADLVLERQDWAGFAPLSLEELLRHFAGVTVARRGGLGSPLYVNILGSVSGQIQVVLDGIEMNEVDANWSRLFGVPVSHIDRILVYRTRDPVRIEVWTRESRAEKPVTDVDVGRGDWTTRTRRLRFATPERPVQAMVQYEELLRGRQDFRTNPTEAATDDLGSYAGRGRWIDGLLTRPNEQRLRFRFFDFVDDSNGSYESQTDRTHTRRTLVGVRFETAIRGRALELDFTNMAWGRSRTLVSGSTEWTESRNSIAADATLVDSDKLLAQALLRGSTHTSVDDPRAAVSALRVRRWDAGFHIATRGRLRWQAWGAWHDDQQRGATWSGRLRAAWRQARWSASADVGRGVSFAGTTQLVPEGSAERFIGVYASAGVERRGTDLTLGARVWGKDFDGRSQGSRELFPLLGVGPERMAGVVAHGQWDLEWRKWLFGLGAQVSWTPTVTGDRGGVPEVQTELLARLARLDWFDGDLGLTAQAVWHAETERRFDSNTTLAQYHVTGFDFNVRLIRRIVFFWHIDNAFDVFYETHPGVLMPRIRNHFGVQVVFFN